MLKKFVLVATCVLVCIIIFQGCFYDKADQQYPSICDTTNITYNVDIKAILDANYCVNCHNPSSIDYSGINLYDYSVISGFALDSNFTYGTLLSAVMHKGGAPFMPQNKPMLQDCDIKKIAAWVHSGAPQQ